MTEQEHLEIVSRFFEAVEWLKETRRIRGLQTFARSCGVDRRSLRRLQADPEKYSLKVGWVVHLVREYGIKADWLLTGEGPMHD
jgi:hypothetical protein